MSQQAWVRKKQEIANIVSSLSVACLVTMADVYTACAVCVTIFSTGSKFQLVSNFKELHALTLPACSYALLIEAIFQISTRKNH